MNLFSQRKGLKPVQSIIQVDSMDTALRNSLWNALSIIYWQQLKDCGFINLAYNQNMDILLKKIWLNYFKYPIDTLSDRWPSTHNQIKKYFFECQWYEVYDFIEYIANESAIYADIAEIKEFINFCNVILEREVSAYRFVDLKITQITSETEIAEIEEALEQENYLKPVATHLEQALNLLADRKLPDYKNSIKESISAVEAICQLIAGKDKITLGQALGEIEKKVRLHPALKKAFISLYGYTSDAEGIRHALLEESNLKFEDAKFILVSCSAFVNYLKSKALEAGISL